MDSPANEAERDPVLLLVQAQRDLSQFLRDQGQDSHALVVEREIPKFLVLSAASYFEGQILDCIESMVAALGDERVTTIVRLKAIKRQYHTFFSWDDRKIGPFKTLFGDAVADELNRRCREDVFKASLDDFLRIGHERNKLVHGNFATQVLTGNVDEWIDRYRSAWGFVVGVREVLSPSTPAAAAPIAEAGVGESGPDSPQEPGASDVAPGSV